MSILLIEDSPSDAMMLEVELHEDAPSCVVENASSLAAARTALSASKYDVVLLDLGLPDSDGLDTYRAIAELARHTAIVVVSGLDDERTAETAVLLGAQDYLVKGATRPGQVARAMIFAVRRNQIIEDLIAQHETNRFLEREVADRTADLVAANTDLADSNRTLQVITSSQRALMHATDETTFMNEICQTVVDAGGYPLAWVGTAETDEDQAIRLVGAAGDVAYLDELHMTWATSADGSEPAGAAIRSEQRHVEADITNSCNSQPWMESAQRHGFQSVASFPIIAVDQFRGALSIYAHEPDTFDTRALDLLQDLARDLSYGIIRLRDAERLKSVLTKTIAALASVSELRDPYTAGHQRRVAELSAAICEQLGVDAEEREGIVTAAAIHDIGKLSVPAELLSKPGRLIPEEMALIKNHPRQGHEIILGIDFPWPVADMVLQHHERLNGSGYPNGLTGDEILRGSRIIAVADTVESMSSHRPYRPALGLAVALAEIEAGRGVLYDSAAVDACLIVCGQPDFGFDPLGTKPFGRFA